MTTSLIAAAHAVREQFMPAENTVDLAAARTARLLATTLEGLATAKLSLGTGAALVRKLTKSLTAQIEAREEFAMAHKLAAALPEELGLSPAMYGDVVPCPPDDPKKSVYFGEADNVVRLTG